MFAFDWLCRISWNILNYKEFFFLPSELLCFSCFLACVLLGFCQKFLLDILVSTIIEWKQDPFVCLAGKLNYVKEKHSLEMLDQVAWSAGALSFRLWIAKETVGIFHGGIQFGIWVIFTWNLYQRYQKLIFEIPTWNVTLKFTKSRKCKIRPWN